MVSPTVSMTSSLLLLVLFIYGVPFRLSMKSLTSEAGSRGRRRSTINEYFQQKQSPTPPYQLSSEVNPPKSDAPINDNAPPPPGLLTRAAPEAETLAPRAPSPRASLAAAAADAGSGGGQVRRAPTVSLRAGVRRHAGGAGVSSGVAAHGGGRSGVAVLGKELQRRLMALGLGLLEAPAWTWWRRRGLTKMVAALRARPGGAGQAAAGCSCVLGGAVVSSARRCG